MSEHHRVRIVVGQNMHFEAERISNEWLQVISVHRVPNVSVGDMVRHHSIRGFQVYHSTTHPTPKAVFPSRSAELLGGIYEEE